MGNLLRQRGPSSSLAMGVLVPNLLLQNPDEGTRTFTLLLTVLKEPQHPTASYTHTLEGNKLGAPQPLRRNTDCGGGKQKGEPGPRRKREAEKGQGPFGGGSQRC